jgi:hypothetical protein
VTLCTGSGSLLQHIYCFVQSSFVRTGEPSGFEPAVWFGLRSYAGRAWGCHVLLECGAVVRDLPLHALAQHDEAEAWTLEQSQHWDCYGDQFSLVRYTYLQGLEARVKCASAEHLGEYLFTACPLGDGFSAEPQQSKEFMFLALRNGRFAAQPTNRVLFIERSFTEQAAWPTDIQRQRDVWSCESAPDLEQIT